MDVVMRLKDVVKHDTPQQKTFTLDDIERIINKIMGHKCQSLFYCDKNNGDCSICEDCLNNQIIEEFEKEVEKVKKKIQNSQVQTINKAKREYIMYAMQGDIEKASQAAFQHIGSYKSNRY